MNVEEFVAARQEETAEEFLRRMGYPVESDASQ